MTNFVPPPMDRKKKDKDEDGGEDDVFPFSFSSLLACPLQSGSEGSCLSSDKL